MAQNLRSEKETLRNSALLQALQLEDRLARQKEVARILTDISEDKAVALLFDALLKSLGSEARQRVVDELAKIGSAKAVELLQAVMTDDFDPKVQRHAVEALKHIRSDKAVDSLLAVLRSGNEWSRREAARALGDFNSSKVVDALIEASRDYFICDTAVFSLAQIGSDRATERLLEVMQDLIHGTGTTSLYAMEGLVRLGTEKAIDGLLQVWNSPVSLHKDRLYLHLSQFKPRHLIVPLGLRLQDKTLRSDIRRAAAQMLGIIGTEDEIPLLESLWSTWGHEEYDRELAWQARSAAEQISFRELKRKAERERALEETRAFIAHEFRHALTPLNAYVKMLDEALNESEIDKEKLSSLTVRIRRQTDTAFELVNQYLDYSRPLTPQIAEIDINNLLKRSLEEFKAEIETRGIALESQFAENAVAPVDNKMLGQVVRNVIVNALDAIGQGGTLAVTTRLDKRDVVIVIRDTGIGVNPEHLPHIFEVGFTTKSNVRGAGVGLALSRRIIEEAHNGSITIANNLDGPGASVLISLPTKRMEMKNGRHVLALADR